MEVFSTRLRGSRSGVRARPPLRLLVLAGSASLIAAIPLVYLAVRIIDSGSEVFSDTIFRLRVLQLSLNSVSLVVAVTLTCLIIGTAVGVFLARFKFPGGRFWVLLAALPLAVPSYLAAYGWLTIFPGLQGFFASWFIMAAVCVPYVSLSVAAVLRDASADPEAVARTLGVGPISAFRLATWPRIRSAAVAGSLLVALYTLSDFGAVAMLRFQTLTWGVKSAYSSSFDRNQAALLAMILVMLAMLVVLAERKARHPTARQSGRRFSRQTLSRPRASVAISIMAASPIIGVLLPLLGLSLQFTNAETLRDTDFARLGSTLMTTVLLAVMGALVAVILALPIATLASRYRTKIVSLIESTGYIGHAIPGIVVGLALVFFSLAVIPFLYQSVAMLVFGYAVLFMSKSIGASRTGLEAVPSSLTDLAQTQGITATQAWRRITLRLAAPSVGVGALLVAIAILKELPATLLLRPTGISTLAVELWNRTSVLEYGAAAPYAALLVLLAAVPAFLLSGVRGVAREGT